MKLIESIVNRVINEYFDYGLNNIISDNNGNDILNKIYDYLHIASNELRELHNNATEEEKENYPRLKISMASTNTIYVFFENMKPFRIANHEPNYSNPHHTDAIEIYINQGGNKYFSPEDIIEILFEKVNDIRWKNNQDEISIPNSLQQELNKVSDRKYKEQQQQGYVKQNSPEELLNNYLFKLSKKLQGHEKEVLELVNNIPSFSNISNSKRRRTRRVNYVKQISSLKFGVEFTPNDIELLIKKNLIDLNK